MNIRRIVIPLALLSVLTLAVWSALAHDGEHHSPGGNGQPNDAPLAAMANVPCVNGLAGTFPCNKVDLAALLPVVDMTNPTAPVHLGNLPRTATAADSLWRSVKVYRNHLFVVSEAVGHGMQV